MKKLLIGFLIAQVSLMQGYVNLDKFYSDKATVKEICKNNPKAWTRWKGSVETACDCLDYQLGQPKELLERFVRDHKQDVNKHQLLAELLEKQVGVLNKPDAFKLEHQAIDMILFKEDEDTRDQAKDEYLDVFVKAFNQALKEAKSKLEE